MLESMEEKLVKQEEENRWKGLASTLHWNPAVEVTCSTKEESKVSYFHAKCT
jgi:hypothetical protein